MGNDQIRQYTNCSFPKVVNDHYALRYSSNDGCKLFELLHENDFYSKHEIQLIKASVFKEDNSLGVFPAYMATCRNLQELIDTFIKSYFLFSNCSYLSSKIENGRIFLTHKFINNESRFNTSQGYLTGLAMMIRQYLDKNIEFRAEFNSKSIQDPLGFESEVTDNVIYNQGISSLSFPASYLKYERPLNIDFIRSKIINEIQSRYTQNNSKNEFIVDRLESWLKDSLGHLGTELTIETAAKDFNMSKSTLFRRLENSNVNFSDLLEKQRREKALELLDCTNLSIACISENLGYNNMSAFTRAFKRWFQITPTLYRSSKEQ